MMRPLPGEQEALPRTTSFTSDNEPTPIARPNQMAYFLTDESAIGEPQSQASAVRPKQPKSAQSSTYGVESLETVTSSLSQDGGDLGTDTRKARRNWKRNLGLSLDSPGSPEDDESEPESIISSRNLSPSHQRSSSQATISRPFTPLSYRSPASASMIGSPDSRGNSDAGSYMDDNASQAIMSSGEEDGGKMASGLLDSGSAPQLVMPTMKMPSRRPFTDKGKNMGRLKVLIAGDSGVGKTALIKAIVQTCEDIVHVDPICAAAVAIPEMRRSSRSKSRSGSTEATTQITEIYASTKPYPTWWSDLEESRILRRRKSMGDSVLERNLCFVDTPGYGNKTSCLESITPVVDYITSHLQKAVSLQDLADLDMISLLSGNGGTQVDLVFYVFTRRVKPVDIEYLRRLSQLTNIIPLVSRSDALTMEELTSLKENITSELQVNNIKVFPLGMSGEDVYLANRPVAPYAISTDPSKGEDTMDASLLMSPDYVQPLLPSELTYLVSRIFERDTISWLRHSAAKKFIQWRSSTNIDKSQALYRPLTYSTSLVPSSSMLISPVGSPNSYTLARVSDHTQREERMAQIRLSNWAADLTRSMQNERRQFEELKIAERAVWLTERLGECVQDGTIVPISRSGQGAPSEVVKHGQGNRTQSRRKRHGGLESGLDPSDPLGLLQLRDDVKRKAIFALRVVGSFGVIGGLALWMSRIGPGREWPNSVMVMDGEGGVLDWLGRLGAW